jgi:C4-dicarboxylate-specific signal transduction histidine kinase
MANEMRKTGVDVVGDMPWGTHFCLFYESKADLLETTVCYCKAGLENREFCLWVVGEPLTEEEARQALKRAVPDLDQYIADHSVEIFAARDWYLQNGSFGLNRVIGRWNEKLASASARGYAGVRVTGDTAWLEKRDWKDFCEYEESLNQAIAGQRLAVLCTYPLAACGASEILDVVRTHQFAVTKRRGGWDVIETAGHKQAKAEIKRLNAELEQRVVERTSQLTSVNKELTKEVLQRKRAEEALLRSEAYLAEAQRVSHTGSFGWSVSSGNIVWSEETFRIFEYDPDFKPTVEGVLQRTHPEDRAFLRERLDLAVRDKNVFDFEHRLLLPNGSCKYLRVVGHPSTNDESGDFEFVGAVMDITESKRAEESLRRTEGYLAEAQRLSHTGSWAFNSRGPLYWSEENFRIWDFNPQQGLPKREAVLQRIHPEDRDRVAEQLKRAVREKGDYDIEFRIVLPDGTVKHIHELGHRVFSASGELIEVIGTQLDVTERKHAEEERERLRQAQADLAHMNRVTTMGELTASLAHEIKQPIAAAVTNAKTCLRWLKRDAPDVTEACEAAARLVKDATRAADIISRVSVLFKKDVLRRELVDLSELVREMIVLLRSEANRYSISIRSELAEDLPKVLADRVQLQQVFMNLMLNGIEAMKEMDNGSELAIKSEIEHGQLVISVSDTGVGLRPEQADDIFRAFFTTKEKGTGMGLPISRSIVESHGGRLWVTPNPGRGATFHFTLPKVAAAHA